MRTQLIDWLLDKAVRPRHNPNPSYLRYYRDRLLVKLYDLVLRSTKAPNKETRTCA